MKFGELGGLMSFVKDVGRIVITFDNYTPEIEIYDDYRE
jgi:hypothetical protein